MGEFSLRRIVTAIAATAPRAGTILASISAALIAFTPARAEDPDKPDPKKVEAGEQAYNDFCQTCHGDNLVSSGQTFDLRRLTPKDRKRFETSVQNGKGQMPPWKGVVSEEQMDAIWHYIMSRRN